MIYIRTDANEVIATGHVMRCMTIADNIVENGEKVTFIISDERSLKLIRQRGFEYICLNTDYANPDNEKEILLMRDILITNETSEKSTLLIDSYSVHAGYVQKLKNIANIAIIEDLIEEVFEADILIHYSILEDDAGIRQLYKNKPVKLLIGNKYVPLRKEFLEGCINRRELSDDIISAASHEDISEETDKCFKNKENDKFNILLISGGGDILNVMGRMLKYMENIKDKSADKALIEKYAFHVVAGAYNPHKAMLNELGRTFENVHIYENVTDMANLMGKCDMAVSAASTTLFECCAMRLPTVFFCVADNQKEGEKTFGANGLMKYAGDVRENGEVAINQLVLEMEHLAQNTELRQTMKINMEKAMDGMGAKRIANELIMLENGK